MEQKHDQIIHYDCSGFCLLMMQKPEFTSDDNRADDKAFKDNFSFIIFEDSLFGYH